MSSSSVAIALNHSRSTGTARLVLIGIAEHDGDGGSWPAVATLARYAGGVDRSTVQRAFATLESLGEIRREINGGGTHATAEHQRPNLYQFLLTCPADCDGSKHHRTARSRVILEPLLDTDEDPAAPAQRGSTSAAGARRTSAAGPAAPTRPEPSFNHPENITSKTTTVARAHLGPCGHQMITATHCAMGCPEQESTLTAAPRSPESVSTLTTGSPTGELVFDPQEGVHGLRSNMTTAGK